MKIRNVSLLLLSLILGIGAVFHFQHNERVSYIAEPTPTPQASMAPPPLTEPVADVRAMLPIEMELAPPPKKIIVPPVIKQAPPKPMVSPEQKRKTAYARYWEQAAKNFERKWQQLETEQNPGRRKNLIESMANNVRIDTLATLDWAMALQNPEEQKAALQAINQKALTGIGARIEIDKSGYPKIRDTTILSAINSTGLVESGDYISGIVNADGSTTSLKGKPIQEIVKLLRGKPGTEVYLQMERPGTDIQPEPSSFDVPVLRSLIVITPPF